MSPSLSSFKLVLRIFSKISGIFCTKSCRFNQSTIYAIRRPDSRPPRFIHRHLSVTVFYCQQQLTLRGQKQNETKKNPLIWSHWHQTETNPSSAPSAAFFHTKFFRDSAALSLYLCPPQSSNARQRQTALRKLARGEESERVTNGRVNAPQCLER